MGLDVPLVVGPGGAVAHVAYGDGARCQEPEPLAGNTSFTSPHIPVRGEHAIIVHRDAGALLAPVLEGVQPIIGALGATSRRIVDSKYSTFLMDCHFSSVPYHPPRIPHWIGARPAPRLPWRPPRNKISFIIRHCGGNCKLPWPAAPLSHAAMLFPYSYVLSSFSFFTQN